MHFRHIRGEDITYLAAERGATSAQTFCKRQYERVIAGIFPCAQEGIFALYLQPEDY